MSVAVASGALLRAVDVVRAFRHGDRLNTAISGLDLHVRAGEFLVVTGPAGSGKTILLHLLAGLDTPTSGSVAMKSTSWRWSTRPTPRWQPTGPATWVTSAGGRCSVPT